VGSRIRVVGSWIRVVGSRIRVVGSRVRVVRVVGSRVRGESAEFDIVILGRLVFVQTSSGRSAGS
jgi:hypothetical protein